MQRGIIASFKKNIADKDILNKILGPFAESIYLPIGVKNSSGEVLPVEARKSGFEKIKRVAGSFGVRTHICGCKNCDITQESCNIVRRPEDFHGYLF